MKTGRGNANTIEIEKAKKYFRKMHPNLIRKVELANFIGCSQARALIILNLLSGVSNDKDKAGGFMTRDFLVFEDDDLGFTRYGISKDVESGI